MSTLFKIEFQYVPHRGAGRQPDAEVPDAEWRTACRETSDPWSQYHELRRMAREGDRGIRNVQLFQMVSQPQWKEIPPEPEHMDRPADVERFKP